MRLSVSKPIPGNYHGKMLCQNNAEKIKIFVHHLEDTETDEFFKLAMERFKGIAIDVSMSPQEISKMTK